MVPDGLVELEEQPNNLLRQRISRDGAQPRSTSLRGSESTAAVEFEADDSMVIAGGISPGGGRQEGKLQAVALCSEKAIWQAGHCSV
jgi:hypothetical protein